MKKFLFFYLKTGGGHISNAKALQKYFENHYANEAEIVLQDGLENSNFVIKKVIEDGYAELQHKGILLYNFLYLCNKLPIFAKINQLLLSEITINNIKKYIFRNKPDYIVIFHFFLIKPIQEIVQHFSKKIKIITIVTDPFTVPLLWFLEKDMKYLVFSEKAKTTGLEAGIPNENIKVFSPIVDEKFEKNLSEKKLQFLREKFNLDSEKKTILLFGGGDGIAKGEVILQELINKKLDIQILVICGKNKSLYKKIQKIIQKNPEKNIQAFEFIHFVDELINVSDIVISKAGPASIMEILHLRKIPIINTYLREQEKGNVEYIVENKVGIYEKNIGKMIEKIEMLLNTNFDTYKENLKNLELVNGAKTISNYLMNKLK